MTAPGDPPSAPDGREAGELESRVVAPDDREAAPYAAKAAPAERRVRLSIVLVAVASLVLAGVVVARAFFVASLKIAELDMAPNLEPGDRVVVRTDAYGREHRRPARGDIVVFRDPGHPDRDVARRVIGLPGDVITIQEGAVFISGWRIPTCVAGIVDADTGDAADESKHPVFAVLELVGDNAYLVLHDPPQHGHEELTESPAARASEGPFTVPHNEVFVLGDNREHSHDSRDGAEGRGAGVPFDQIKGRASSIWMSQGKDRHMRWGKPGSDLTAEPACPEGFPKPVCEAIERRLSIRPPTEQRTPPIDRSPAPPASP